MKRNKENQGIAETKEGGRVQPNLLTRFIGVVKSKGLKYTLTIVLKTIKHIAIRLFKKVITPPSIFADHYYMEDNAEIILFTSENSAQSFFSSYRPQKQLQPSHKKITVTKVSLIATVRNEESNIRSWVESVYAQSRLPDEIIITDAGSTDKTVEILKQVSSQSPVPFRIISIPGANIAQGRNAAIRQAQFDLIATSDFGCRLHTDWMEKLMAPFDEEPGLDVSAGMYQAVDRHGNKLNRRAWWTNDASINLRWFLPSGRSSAYTKEIWKTIGGYPEWLTMTGEDTFFALELKKYAEKWAFVPEAIVDWHAPDTALAYWSKMFAWSVGEGESGLYASSYWKLGVQVLFLMLWLVAILIIQASIWTFAFMSSAQTMAYFLLGAWFIFLAAFAINLKIPLTHLPLEMGGLIAKILGFLRGVRNQPQINIKRRDTVKGTFFILSGIPIDDTGGGARCTQISLELLRRKYAVVYINRYPKYETKQLNLSIEDHNLFTFQLAQLDWDKFIRENGWLLDKGILAALVEMPIEEFIPAINFVAEHGGVVLYDMLDDWATPLGGSWYSPETEVKIIRSSHVMLATAPVLAERLSHLSGKSVEMLPNAVNTILFNPHKTYDRPADMPLSDWTIIYIGALWGEWFDWDLLSAIAKRYTEASVIVIGDYKGESPVELPNLHFLGLKPQKALPAYLAYSDVTVIPWKINQITQATSPLKVYEYLAMRKPVVAPDLYPLRGIPGTYLAHDTNDFLTLIGSVRQEVLPEELISQFIRQNSWQTRVDCLLNLLTKAQSL